MTTFNIKQEWISVVALAAMLALSVLLYPSLPDVIPIHWDYSGQPDDFAPKLQAVFGLPLGAILVYALLFIVPKIDPRRASLERSAETYILIRTVVMVFFLFIHALALFGSMRPEQTLNATWVTVGMGLLFLALGNYMPRMRPSWIAGIRTPWTLSSDRVWTQTHRVGGRTFVLAGVLICAATLLPSPLGGALIAGALAFAVLFPIAYSYWLWRQETGNAQ